MSEVSIGRRGFLVGLGALFAAPAIVRVTSIMPVRSPRFITLAKYAEGFSSDDARRRIVDMFVETSSIFEQMPFVERGLFMPPRQRWLISELEQDWREISGEAA